MKNGMMIWNVVLSLVAGVLLFLQFGSKKKGTADKGKPTTDTLNTQFRIAYFEMDSVENNFNLIRDVKAEISQKEIEYNNSVSQLDEAYKRKFNELSKENMTPEQVEAAQATLRQYGESLKNQKLKLDQDFQEFSMLKSVDVKKKIETYLTIFNKDKKYSYIIAFEQGLFYYKDSAYNITGELIGGLNDYYKQLKKK